MEFLSNLDREWFLFLNSYHSPVMDRVMMWVTQTETWIPLYALLLFLFVKAHKKNAWIPLLGVAICLTLADQTTSSLMKPFFARLRPSHDPALEGLVHVVDGYLGGRFGFASSHASTTFGTAYFCWYMLRYIYPWTAWLFLWAALMTYSRIYLGVHYPGDVAVGAIVGIGSAYVAIGICAWLERKLEKPLRTPFP